MTNEGIPALTVSNLSKSFGGVKAIDNVSLKLEEGRSRVLIGPNGAGKTTLFNLITGETPMDEGDIHLFGENISREKVQRRSELGLTRTYQISNLFKELTAEENLYLSLKGNLWNSRSAFSSLWTSWKAGKKTKSHVLQDVSLTVNSLERVAVLGRNGMGKSTLLKSILRLQDLRVEGDVHLKNETISQAKTFEVAQKGIAYPLILKTQPSL